MSLGKTFKKIRINKNLKQTYFITPTLSQSMISYFENDQRKIEAENFLYLLEKLQINLEEFNLIRYEYKKSSIENIYDMFNSLKFNEENAIKNLLNECKKYKKTHNDIYVEQIIKICKALLILSKDNAFDKAREVIIPIWEYYEKKDYWYLHDLKIINSILFIFKGQDAIYVTNQMIKNINRLPDDTSNKALKLSIRSNLTVLLMENGNWSNSLNLLHDNIAIYKLDMNYILLSVHLNRIAICMYKLKISNYLSYINKANTLLDCLDEDNFKIKLQREFET